MGGPERRLATRAGSLLSDSRDEEDIDAEFSTAETAEADAGGDSSTGMIPCSIWR